MKSRKRVVFRGVLILMLSVSLMAGCAAKPGGPKSNSFEPAGSKTVAAVLPADALASIAGSGTVVKLTSDGPAAVWMIPKARGTALAETVSWLKQAKPYDGEIPKSQFSGTFAANMGPAVLYLITPDQHELEIQPASYLSSGDGRTFKVCYVADVLELKNDEQISYIQSRPLYDWLKNDEWKTQFEPE